MNKMHEIQTTISYSYIYAVDNLLNIYTHSAYPVLNFISEDLLKLIGEVSTIFISLPNLVGEEEEYKSNYIDRLLYIRNTLTQNIIELFSYQREIFHILSLFQLDKDVQQHIIDELDVDPEFVASIDFSDLAAECTEFVFDVEENDELHQKRAADILIAIPSTMTTAFFIDYVSKSIPLIHSSDDETSIDGLLGILELYLNPFSDTNTLIRKNFDFIETLNQLKTITDYQALEEETSIFGEEIDNLMTICDNLFNACCGISNLLVLDDIEFESISSLHPTYSDFYYSIKNIVEKSADTSFLLEAMPERVEQTLHQIGDEYLADFKIKPSETHINVMHANLAASVGDALTLDVLYEPTQPDEYCKQAINEFIKKTEAMLKSLPKREAKLRMQYFLSVIPFIMSNTKLYEYIITGFGNNITNTSLLLAFRLFFTLESSGYFEE
ncbi:MAG: hypothetical protein ATN35_13265 [Epulopiscium sp. Nele67-Bin004]|nr:MAG: hypothetical protein ATN35_13265 [Epulopiscium sp. Nele67-Bin004]